MALTPFAAAEVDLAWTGMGPYEEGFWSYDDGVSWDSPDRGTGLYGLLGLSVFNGGEYEGYCYEIEAPVSEAPVPYSILSIDDYNAELQARFSFVANLYDTWYEEAKIAAPEVRNAIGAALALLTNELMEENYDFIPGTWLVEDVQLQSSTTMGAVQFSGMTAEVEFFYGEMLLGLDFGTQEQMDGLVMYVSEEGFQAFVGYVPAPSALALLGLSGLASRRRRNA
ncbi:MAG: hypothetical protein CMJ54_09395 [Planctomycetaceae bacterium]|nr:hypothetical protein [Planctomycetaceae bacterium]